MENIYKITVHFILETLIDGWDLGEKEDLPNGQGATESMTDISKNKVQMETVDKENRIRDEMKQPNTVSTTATVSAQ